MNAIIAYLGSDLTLLGLMPNGVYDSEAPPGCTRFVIVSQVTAADEPLYGAALEHHYLAIEARSLASSGGDVRAAAVQIDALLEPDGHPPALTIPGYDLVGIIREEPLRPDRERDDVDRSIVWMRRGHRYRVDVHRMLTTA